MSKYGVLEARNMFSALVDRAANGKEVTITCNGKPVAKRTKAGNAGDVCACAREDWQMPRARRV
jgi:hypothetical protein